MKLPVPKSNHFVPQMLLRRFTDEGGKLYYFGKPFAHKGVLLSTPENMFNEKNLYTRREKDGTRNVALEQFYAELESLAGPIVEKIVGAARNGVVPSLTEEERYIWDVFHYSQWKRVPDFQKRFFTGEELEQDLDKWLAEYEKKYRPVTDEERRSLSDPAERERIRHNARVVALRRISPRVMSHYNSRGVAILVIRQPGKSFVIGSFPVVKLTNPGQTSLAANTVEAWLPVAHDVVVGPGLAEPGTENLVALTDDALIRHLNEATFKQSTVIAGRSGRLIASLAGIRRPKFIGHGS